MALFKSTEERRIERDIRIRQGIRRIEKSIREQAKFQDEFIRNARRAKEIGDTSQYQFIRSSLKKTATIRHVLERQLLAVKNALLIKRQAEAAADFTQSMSIMAGEIGKLFGQTDLAKTQAISDEEIDRLIEAEAEAEHAKEMDRLAGLRAELDSLKQQGEKQK
jgi:hypothetical protein